MSSSPEQVDPFAAPGVLIINFKGPRVTWSGWSVPGDANPSSMTKPLSVLVRCDSKTQMDNVVDAWVTPGIETAAPVTFEVDGRPIVTMEANNLEDLEAQTTFVVREGDTQIWRGWDRLDVLATFAIDAPDKVLAEAAKKAVKNASAKVVFVGSEVGVTCKDFAHRASALLSMSRRSLDRVFFNVVD